MDLYDVQQVLEEGFNCFRSKLKKEIEEKRVRKGKKLLKVVVEKMQSSCSEEYWRIRHAGILAFKRKKFLVK